MNTTEPTEAVDAEREAIAAEGASLDEVAPIVGNGAAPAEPGGTFEIGDDVRVDVVPFHAALEIAIEVLVADGSIAQRNGELVHVTEDPRGGPPRVSQLGKGHARDLLSRGAWWCAEVKDNPRAMAYPPDAIVEALVQKRPSWPPQFRVLPADDCAPARDWLDVVNDPTPPWLVGGIIPIASLVVLAGHPNAGKTFLGLDLAARLPHGLLTWLGRELPAASSVLYFAADGPAGIAPRLRAWMAAHPDAVAVGGHYLAVRSGVPNLAGDDAADALSAIIDEVAAQHDGRLPGVVIVDTWSASLVGVDENDAGAASAALHALGALRRRYGCTVIVVHHQRKAANGSKPAGSATMHELRGSGALAGAADVILLADGERLAVVKARDSAKPEPIAYRIVVHPTGRPGETSAIVVAAPALPRAPEVNEAQQLAAAADRRVEAVVATVVAMGGYAPTARSIVDRTVGKDGQLYAAIAEAVTAGKLQPDGRGFRAANAEPEHLQSPSSLAARCLLPLKHRQRGSTKVAAPAPAAWGDAGSSGQQRAAGSKQTNTDPADDGLSEKPPGGGAARRRKRAAEGGR